MGIVCHGKRYINTNTATRLTPIRPVERCPVLLPYVPRAYARTREGTMRGVVIVARVAEHRLPRRTLFKRRTRVWYPGDCPDHPRQRDPRTEPPPRGPFRTLRAYNHTFLDAYPFHVLFSIP